MSKKKNELIVNQSNLGEKLWDEITKSIADHMPNQLFPLFREAFGKTYPKGTSIQLLQTEYPIPDKKTNKKLTSVYSDITLLVNGTDLYHIECQMSNDADMIVRMIEYDFHFALRHGIQMEAPNIYTLYFPNSTVLYPDTKESIPDNLICRVIFPDGSIHKYQVPTMKIQSYSLEDIRQKHLTLFIPFKLLSFRPRLKSKTNPIRQNELTEYIKELIFILDEEYKNGNITNHEYKDYIGLINLAAERVFNSQQDLKEEVLNVTKSVLVLPSDLYREAEEAKQLRQTLKEREAEIADKNAILADKDAKLADKDAKLADKDAIIAELTALLNSK